MKKTLGRDIEFIVEIPTGKMDPESNQPTSFIISPETIEVVSKSLVEAMPKFKISGKLHRSVYPINTPFTGEVCVESANVPLKSIELQLVRIESVFNDGKFSREATEVQNIQIGDGNVCRNLLVPLYMVFPRLFSCSSISSTHFKIQFEVNLIIIFTDGYVLTENFPITICREQ